MAEVWTTKQTDLRAVGKSEKSGPLDNQTWPTKWKTAPLAKVQLCEYENQTFFYSQPVVRLQNSPFPANAREAAGVGSATAWD